MTAVWSAPSLAQQSPRRYEVITETDMPHLEENLRYAVRREPRCLDPHDLSTAFWMLGHVSLQDCRLVKAAEDASSATYRLQCDGGHGTTGEARWQFESDHLTGTLRVRLGGKNMTFYQRITATPVRSAIKGATGDARDDAVACGPSESSSAVR
jgi:hypothetical protein